MKDELFPDRFITVAIGGQNEVKRDDFRLWCSAPDNLERLGHSIGMRLACVEPEVRAGPFTGGILCKDHSTGSYVLIETQLPPTDLARLIELKRNAIEFEILNIVWIAEKLDDKHRATLDWLNCTDLGGIRFFGIEIVSTRPTDGPVSRKIKSSE